VRCLVAVTIAQSAPLGPFLWSAREVLPPTRTSRSLSDPVSLDPESVFAALPRQLKATKFRLSTLPLVFGDQECGKAS